MNARKQHGLRAAIANDPILGGITPELVLKAFVGVGIVYAAVIAITAFIGWW